MIPNEPLIVVIKRMLDREHNFAYSSFEDATLAEVLHEGKCLKMTRTDAERAAAQDYRVRVPSDQDNGDKLLEEGKIQVWDLKEELAVID
ncbi:hypothetical protein G3O08_14915 [Cryomorpha ignava]|uniref:Uncharacterized protein n=1 Tax=Cryomorpha ignava TaxID=101383 RepID=A0A7K3WSX5_9FLAO|nr:hypothetical protein [Cryomorpha ignava]NEN24793.1 hypothetical protein [Cryomorpha ignava]